MDTGKEEALKKLKRSWAMAAGAEIILAIIIGFFTANTSLAILLFAIAIPSVILAIKPPAFIVDRLTPDDAPPKE